MLKYAKVLGYIYQNHKVFGQAPKSSSKVLFKLGIFFMATFIVVLDTQI